MLPLLRGATQGPNVSQLFAASLWTGNDAVRTITSGIDADLVWIKRRSTAASHHLYDTARGATKRLASEGTGAETTVSDGLQSFTSTGFTLGPDSGVNSNPETYVGWSFGEAARFFDVVTYTGTGVARTVAHSLGTTPGLIIVKRRDTSSTLGWITYHRSNQATPQNHYLRLNSTADGTSTGTSIWNNTAPTSTEFTVGTNDDVNASGGTYVAYLFAHDTASDGIVQCGGFSISGGAAATVTLGWQPQFVLTKRSDSTQDWQMFDEARGLGTSYNNSARLQANLSDAETAPGGTARIAVTTTGFTWNPATSTESHVYLAIRKAA